MNRYGIIQFLLLCLMLSIAPVSQARPKGKPRQQKQPQQEVQLQQQEQPQQQQEQPQPQPEPPKPLIRLVAPAENATVVEKKPRIACAVDVPYSSEGLVVMLDNTDITSVLDATPEGFEYSPVQVMAPGPHTLSVRLLTREGTELQQQFGFTTRHGGTFETAYSSNELTLLVEDLQRKPAGADFVPESRVEGNLRSDTRLATGNTMVSFSTNLRYLNQSAPVYEPQKKGVIDAANWILTGAYTKDRFRLDTAVGDIILEQTPYTLSNFGRRGGKAAMDFDDRYHLDLFSVTSRPIIGFREGAGIGFDTYDHIVGMSAGVKLFEKRMELKALRITGGVQDLSFATYPSTAVTQKGDVTGLVVNTDFFSGKIRTEAELDSSRYDPDIADEFASKTDKAWKARVSGSMDRYTYDALYEKIGRDYAVVGSQWLQKDREGASLRGGANFDGHGVNVMLSQYHDNVRNDELFPRIVNEQAGVDYQYAKIQNLTLGLGYQAGRQNSVKEPEGSFPVEMHTDGVTGRLNYLMGSLALGFQATCSRMNDLSEADRDSRAVTYSFTPAYNAPGLSVNPVLTLNKSTDLSTDVTMDTTTANLDLRSGFFNNRVSFDLGGTYNIMKSDDDLIDQRSVNAAFRLAYNLKGRFTEYLKPSLGLRGTHGRTRDLVTGAHNEETTLFLVLAASMPFSF